MLSLSAVHLRHPKHSLSKVIYVKCQCDKQTKDIHLHTHTRSHTHTHIIHTHTHAHTHTHTPPTHTHTYTHTHTRPYSHFSITVVSYQLGRHKSYKHPLNTNHSERAKTKYLKKIIIQILNVSHSLTLNQFLSRCILRLCLT